MNTNRHEYRWRSFAATPSRNEAHPGARASRPHAPPSRAAQYVYDVAAGNLGSGNGVGLGEADPWRVCRSSGVEEMREAVRRRMRAGRPRSRVGLLRCGFADSRHWKLAVSLKNPVHPVHPCQLTIAPCVTLNRFPATKRRRLFQARARRPPGREMQTGQSDFPGHILAEGAGTSGESKGERTVGGLRAVFSYPRSAFSRALQICRVPLGAGVVGRHRRLGPAATRAKPSPAVSLHLPGIGGRSPPCQPLPQQ